MHSPRPTITDVSIEWPSVSEIVQTLTFQAGYNTSIVLAGTTLLGVAAGIIGAFALLRKRSLMGDALSHASLPGIALAFIIAAALGFSGKSLAILLPGAAITGVLAILAMQFMIRQTRLPEDAAIGVALSVFFGAGVVLLSYVQTMSTGDQAGLATFIYGQTAAMNVRDTALMGAIAIAAILAAGILLKEFALVCFDEDFAAVQGWPVTFIDLLMMTLVVLVTVVGLQAVGLILVVALLIIPPAAARFWTERLGRMIIISGVIGGASGYFGSAASALLPRLPAGSVIVLAAGLVFFFSMALAPRRGVLANLLRAVRLRLKIARDHMLLEIQDVSSERKADWRRALNDIRARRNWSRLTGWIVLSSLTRRGLARTTKEGVELTDDGILAAKRVARTRRLWERYLIRYADVAPSHVDWSADVVEHVLSPDLVAELESILQREDEAFKNAAGATA